AGVGRTSRARWEQVAQDVPEIGEVRGVGAMIGVEMVADRETKEPNEAFLTAVIRGAMAHGVIAVSCGIYHNVLRHLLPLVISDEELDEGLDVFADAAQAAHRGAAWPSPRAKIEGE